MEPLLKWPGGKSQEFQHIKNLIPEHKRYIEPFFGGGAVYFKLQPRKSLINDIDPYLINLYRILKRKKDRERLQSELFDYAESWSAMTVYAALFENAFRRLHQEYKLGQVSQAALTQKVAECLKRKSSRLSGLIANDFLVDTENFYRQIQRNVAAKIVRISEIEVSSGDFSVEDLNKNLETAIRSGFYMHFRDLMNWEGPSLQLSRAKGIANFYFVREFCYGAMFRYNSKGEFNIPYGGIAYNTKNFRRKVEALFEPGVTSVLSGSEIRCGDFSNVINGNLRTSDFMFLDPPYDSEFSDYSNHSFAKADQERLAACLHDTPAKYILVIKNTPFVYNLYKRQTVFIESFDKKYLYNVKGRNDRKAEHLIVRNFVG